ncbi:TauD/TfdA family dioxygenase [Nocardia sp. NPDC005825]|uniref:TauD/TfdA dioxygenase family protein n=1 Tax=unclassified Nocardia TaxID=2637762 RepID=UPI0033D32C1C
MWRPDRVRRTDQPRWSAPLPRPAAALDVRAYDSLDEETKNLIDGRDAIHDFSRAFGHALPEDKRDEMRAAHPMVAHPIVAAHPETGKKHLYVNRIFVEQIEGMDRDEGAELLDRICRSSVGQVSPLVVAPRV